MRGRHQIPDIKFKHKYLSKCYPIFFTVKFTQQSYVDFTLILSFYFLSNIDQNNWVNITIFLQCMLYYSNNGVMKALKGLLLKDFIVFIYLSVSPIISGLFPSIKYGFAWQYLWALYRSILAFCGLFPSMNGGPLQRNRWYWKWKISHSIHNGETLHDSILDNFIVFNPAISVQRHHV